MNSPKLTDRLVAVAFIALMLLVLVLVLRIVQLQSNPGIIAGNPPLRLYETVSIVYEQGGEIYTVSGDVIRIRSGWVSIRQAESAHAIPINRITRITKRN